jgi:elongation factor Ts
MAITASQVKELRELTGAGMMDAKNALVESGGDIEKASELLRQKGIATAAKKSGRLAAEGLVSAFLSHDGQQGVLLEVNCETDFVARGVAFGALVDELGTLVLKNNPSDLASFLQQPVEGAGVVQDYLVEKVAQIKENISLRRFTTYQVAGCGLLHSYIHTGGKIGVLIELSAGQSTTVSNPAFAQLAKDIAMHTASFAPEFLSRHEIDQSVIDEETRVEMGKEDLQNKPEAIRAKIVAGRVDKLLAAKVLLEQPFVKDPSKTIQALLEEQSKTLGDTISIARMVRYALGEGMAKREDNFAAEVMATACGIG